MARPYLRRRGWTYSFRLRVPADLVPLLRRKEVGASLDTACLRAARVRAAALHAKLAAGWELMRAMTQETDDREAQYAELVAVLEESLRLSEEVRGLEARSSTAGQEAASLRDAASRVRDAKERAGRSTSLRREGEALIEEVGRARERVEQERTAGKLSTESLEVFESLMARAGLTVRDRPTPRISEFLETEYLAADDLAEDARRHIKGYLEIFAKAVGDKPVGAVSAADLKVWMGKLVRLPTNYGKSVRDRGKGLDQVLREAAGLPTINRTTVDKHVMHVRRFMARAAAKYRFASGDDVREMFAALKTPKGVPKALKRTRWPLPALQTLLRSPIWTGTRSRFDDFPRRHEVGPWVYLDAYWWLPVLALHSGARLEELAQLHHQDLGRDEETGILYLDLTDEGGRRLKNENSRRKVPLHPLLLELRAAELFVPGRRGRIFPELKPAGRPLKIGGQYSEDFTAYRRAVGVYERLRDFHALRHTFTTAMRSPSGAGADAGLVAQIVGHQEGLVAEGEQQTHDYTQFPLADRASAMGRLDWEAQGLDLSHLRRAVSRAGGPMGRVRATDLTVGRSEGGNPVDDAERAR